MAVEAICLVRVARIVIRVIISEFIPVRPLAFLPWPGALIVAIIQGKIDVIIVEIGEPDAFFLVPGQGKSGCVFIVIIRESAVGPVGSMVGFERVADFCTLLGFEFFRTSQSPIP